MGEFERELWVPHPPGEVFQFFARPENLQVLTPPWLNFRILTALPIQMEKGAHIAYRLKLRGIPLTWVSEIQRWNPPFEFVDVQVKGPYKLWRHTHRFTASGNGTSIADSVEYTLPLGLLGRLLDRLQVARDLDKIFDYRARQMRELFP